jgi:hypothetical protein
MTAALPSAPAALAASRRGVLVATDNIDVGPLLFGENEEDDL